MVPRGLRLVELGLLRVRQLLSHALGTFNVQLNLRQDKKQLLLCTLGTVNVQLKLLCKTK